MKRAKSSTIGAAVETGKIEFSPKSWEKTYFEWMYNIRDWCISRQLWWGHQIPAWYCARCQAITVARETPKACGTCQAPPTELKQDEDVLDTWFSSALWPFSTLGWPDQTAALKTFYPTSILETGFDIIFFWVARMIMLGIHFMGDVPFRKVYLHAMVRDEKGEKMSKTKGNVIDPLVLIDQHGADPLRFTLAAMAGQGRDIKLAVDRVEGYRGFCNKLWNAVKFFHLQWDALKEKNALPDEPAGGVAHWLAENHLELQPQNRWIVSRLETTITAVEKGLQNFELNESAMALYEFAWLEFCDWYIELSKISFREGGESAVQSLYTLYYVIDNLLRLLHPFMPFVTETLWQSLPWKKAANTPARAREGKPEIMTLMFQPFPKPGPAVFKDNEAVKMITALKSVVEALRNFRGENGISPKTEFVVKYHAQAANANSFIKLFARDLKTLGRLSDLVRTEDPKQDNEAIIPLSNPPVELRISLVGLVNTEEESKRLAKEIEKISADIDFVQKKLSQESFIAKAPMALVEKERKRESEMIARRSELDAALARLAGAPGKALPSGG